LRRPLEPIVALLACLAGAVMLRLPTLKMPLDRDSAVYAVIGRSLGSALPYRDLIDHKQPVVYPVYWLLDVLAPRSEVAIRLASAVVAGLAAWLLFLALRPHVGRTRAAAAAALALVLGASRFVQGFELNTEHLLVLTGTLLVVVALRLGPSRSPWAPVVVGLLCGLAILTKAVGVLLAPAALAPFLLARPRQPAARVLVAFGVGTAVPLLAVAALYAAHGALGDLVTWNWTYNRRYTSALPFSDRVAALRTYPADLLLIGLSAVASLVWLRVRGWRDALAWTLVAWLAGAVVGALLGGYGYAHYFAPMTVPAAALLVIPVRAAWSPRVRAAAAAVAVVAVAPFAFELVRSTGQSAQTLSARSYGDNARVWSSYGPVGRLVRARSRPGDRLYVAGNEAGFYWQTGLAPSTRVLYDSPLLLRPQLTGAVVHDLCTRPPRFVVLPLGALPPYAACLGGAGYREVGAWSPAVRVLQRG
jgi:4-amino-4-deoxy-L-arabinose transferase-like glycosyltransferase